MAADEVDDAMVRPAESLLLQKRVGVTDLLSLSAVGSFREELPPHDRLDTQQHEQLRRHRSALDALRAGGVTAANVTVTHMFWDLEQTFEALGARLASLTLLGPQGLAVAAESARVMAEAVLELAQ